VEKAPGASALFGAPSYMGSVSGPFETFMDAASTALGSQLSPAFSLREAHVVDRGAAIACVHCLEREAASKPRQGKVNKGSDLGYREPSRQQNQMHRYRRMLMLLEHDSELPFVHVIGDLVGEHSRDAAPAKQVVSAHSFIARATPLQRKAMWGRK
jgi:multimeric flavodoxin WrbA